MQIVHRDISPSNIFISKRGDVKLGDFGIAHAQRRESKTQAGTLKGKYGYMSPEQVVGRPIDARSDLFAVGVVLAELLTGRRLFSAPADLDVLLKVRDVKLDRLDKYGADLPKRAGPHRPAGAAEGPARALRDRGGVARRAGGLPVLGRASASARAICARSPERCSTPAPTRPRACSRRRAAWRRRKPGTSPRRRRRGGGPARAPDVQPAAPRRRRRAGRTRDRFRRRRRWRPMSSPTCPPPRRPTRPARAAGPTTRSATARRRPASRRYRGPATRASRCRPRRAPGRRDPPRTATSGGSSRRRRSARPTARATSASSRRCGCSAIWRWRARRASCTSSSAAP